MLKSKFNGWTLDKKIYFVVTSLIYAISVIMLIIFSIFYVTSYIDQSNSIARDQLSSMAINYASTLDNYKELAEALTIDDTIQAYVKSGGPASPGYFELVTAAKNTLQNAQNMYSELMFVAVVSYRFDDYVYKGTISKISSNFKSVYPEDYAGCMIKRDTGTLRMDYNKAYLGEQRLLNVYFPVYSISNMIHENGLLCMILDSKLLDGLVPENNMIKDDSDLIIVDGTGGIVSCSDKRLTGTSFDYMQNLSGISGNFRNNSHLYIFQKIGKWNCYLVSRIPLIGMYRDCALMILLLFFFCVTVAYIGQFICRRIISKAYQPLNDVIQMMNYAAGGELDARVSLENVGNDFIKLADGFNYMMEKINTLMEQVKLDQRMAEQLRFNALQSQIQPHFLYNALDCIHWQASAEGNEEISAFIKALAQFYRLCLSKGRDVIPFEQELEHVRNYLIIQNIRYDHILTYTIDTAEDCRDVPIPKITLQPLVENSIYHGIKVKEGRRGELHIEAYRNEGYVFIRLSDNGTGMSDEQILRMNKSISEYHKDFGYGVQNVNKRIELLFGKEYGLHYEKNETGGVTVTIRLPGGNIHDYNQLT